MDGTELSSLIDDRLAAGVRPLHVLEEVVHLLCADPENAALAEQCAFGRRLTGEEIRARTLTEADKRNWEQAPI